MSERGVDVQRVVLTPAGAGDRVHTTAPRSVFDLAASAPVEPPTQQPDVGPVCCSTPDECAALDGWPFTCPRQQAST